MAVTEQVYNVASRLVLNYGTSQTGRDLNKNLSIGPLNTAAYDAQKVYNIAELLADCLTRSVRRVDTVKTLSLVSDQ